MKTFKATIQIMGFVEVSVDAETEAEARAKIEKGTYDGEEVSSAMFNGYETEPEEEVEP